MIATRNPISSIIILTFVAFYPYCFCSSETHPEIAHHLPNQELGVIYSPHEVERGSRQFSFFEWLFGPPVTDNSTGLVATSHSSHQNKSHLSEQSIVKKISAKNAHLLGQPNKTDEDESPSFFSVLNRRTTSLIPRNNSDSETSQKDSNNISHLAAKPRINENYGGGRSNHSRQMEITDIQKSVGTQIDDTHVNSDPSQLNLQEELDVIDHVEKSLANANNNPKPLSRSDELSSSSSLMNNKTRTKRQSKSTSSSRFRQLNIPYGSGANNMLLAKRQLLMNPVDQQMLALRQQQELAAATILTQQQMLNRLSSRYVDDYYDDDDSSYEDSDEFFDDYRRYGMRNPINDNRRQNGPYLRPNHPMGLGRRSLPDEVDIPVGKKSPGSVFNSQKKEKKQGKAAHHHQESGGGSIILGPISKQGRWETIEDYDVDSEFNRIQSRKGVPAGIIGSSFNMMKPSKYEKDSEETDETEEAMHNNGISRIGSLARHNLMSSGRQGETSSEESSTTGEEESSATSTSAIPAETSTESSSSSTDENSTPNAGEETTTNETPVTSLGSGENTSDSNSTEDSTTSSTTSIPGAGGSNSTTDNSSSSSSSSTTTTEIPVSNMTTGGMSSTTKKPASTTKKPKPGRVPPFRQTLNCRCGVQSVRGEDVGDGTIIRTMVNPWLVAVSSKQNGNSVHLCSGSIINNKYVLTSKQCVRGKKTLVVTAGTGSRATKNFTVTRVVAHDTRDLALLKFKPPLNPNQSMRPICLPLKKSSFKFEPLTGTLVTFKKSTNVKSGSYFLQLVQTEVPLESGQKCSSESEGGGSNHLSSGTFCPGPPGSLRCGGDTGGILQAYQKGFSYEQIGVVSSTVGCRANKAPGVYTDVRQSVKWVLYQTKDARYCRKPKVSRKELMEARRGAVVTSEGNDEAISDEETGESEEDEDEFHFDEEFDEE